jgi:hypothetical protein
MEREGETSSCAFLVVGCCGVGNDDGVCAWFVRPARRSEEERCEVLTREEKREAGCAAQQTRSRGLVRLCGTRSEG